MSKKHKFIRPQARKRQKRTTGKLELVDVLYIEKIKTDEGEKAVGKCTCGWATSDKATTFTKIGLEAREHVTETGHQLRKHHG